MTFTIINWNNELFRVFIDDKDAKEVLCCKWHVAKCRGHIYVKRWDGKKRVYLHHFLLGKQQRGFDVDHINGNGLDNRRRNLRVVTHSDNLSNTGPAQKRTLSASSYKGVWFEKRTGKWCADLTVRKIKHRLGTFPTEKEAARAYNRAVIKFRGPVGYTNRGLK